MWHVAYVRTWYSSRRSGFMSKDLDASIVDTQNAQNTLEQGCFTSITGTDQAIDPASWKSHSHAVENFATSEIAIHTT